MKYLNKFNESLSKEKYDDIQNIFSDIFHEVYETGFRVSYATTLGTFNITIDMPRFETSGNPYTGTKETTIEDLIKTTEKLNELYLDIDISIKRMMDYFPETEYKILHNKVGTINIKIV